jgi:hypothetical protein
MTTIIIAVGFFTCGLACYCFGYSAGSMAAFRAVQERKVPTGNDEVFTTAE